MKNQETIAKETVAGSALERIAQSIAIAYAWVSGPALSEQQRIQNELVKSRLMEKELESTSIVI